jgi:hypothetical protein
MFKLHTFLNTQSSYKVGNTSAVSKKKPWDKLPTYFKSLNKSLRLTRFLRHPAEDLPHQF